MHVSEMTYLSDTFSSKLHSSKLSSDEEAAGSMFSDLPAEDPYERNETSGSGAIFDDIKDGDLLKTDDKCRSFNSFLEGGRVEWLSLL